jgi:hypothetical protein
VRSLESVVALSLTWGQAPVKAFLAACIAAIVLAAIGWIVFNRMQEPADRAFATPPIRGSAIRPGEAQDLSPSIL